MKNQIKRPWSYLNSVSTLKRDEAKGWALLLDVLNKAKLTPGEQLKVELVLGRDVNFERALAD